MSRKRAGTTSTRAVFWIVSICLGAWIMMGYNSLPPLKDRTAAKALPSDTARTSPLGQIISPQASAHPGQSGIHPLQDPHDAFAARMVLTQAAQHTLDIQYYIWRKDLTGTLLFAALLAAADRGVHVRLLLDDNNTAGLDETLAALDSHPNIEIRLFNPFAIRSARWIGFITDFSRSNRRMHNKSFTADNQATIIGGRNIGDEYFGATDGILFADMDVLAAGPVVDDVSNDFDLYWASDSSYPVELILPLATPAQLSKLASNCKTAQLHPAATAYMRAWRTSTLMRKLHQGSLTLHWAVTQMVSDDPAKGLGHAPHDQLITHAISRIIGQPKSELELVSPYFVPGAEGVKAFTAMAEHGVKIKILTNSLDATDVPAVHAGYAKRRKPLLAAGIELYEMRRLSPEMKKDKSATRFGSSGSSLHAKTFSVDRSRVFVGSFNFDPRSAKLNTELGFIIESPAMAMQIEAAFKDTIPANSYEVRLSNNGTLYWLDSHQGRVIRYDNEPETSFWTRAWVGFLSILPIEWLL